MAKRIMSRRPLAAALFPLAMIAVVGCQSAPPAQMVDRQAGANGLAGPDAYRRVEPAPAQPAPRPLAVKPSPRPLTQVPAEETAVLPMPAPAAIAGVPRDWVPSVAPRKWEWIVVHHSATAVGGASRFAKEHMAKGWDELGYHFVIGNGTDTGNGAVEVGTRWPKQKQGAHCRTPNNNFNEKGIGICLVGNFDSAKPTDAQLKSLAKVVAYLQKTYRIPADRVIGHGDAKATDCPGRNLHIATVRRLSAQVLADAGDAVPVHTAAAVVPGQEMMFEDRRTPVSR